MSSRRKTTARHALVHLALLPLPERLFVVLLLACALGPALARAYAATAPASDTSALAAFGRAPWLLSACAVGVALLALLVFERPRSLSPRAYAAQLRARLLRAQSHYDAAKRRRFPEESNHEENEAVVRR